MLAHRGLAVHAPENTLTAFRDALRAGATHLETDVQLSADGVAVLSHDADLLRTLGRPDTVASLGHRQLRELDLGAGEGYLSLAEALEALPEARFNIDVKADGAEGPTARAVLAAGATDRVLITSFSGRRRKRTVTLLPGVMASASSGQVVAAILAATLGSRRLMRRALRGVHATQVPERRGRLRIVTRRFVRAVHAAGAEVHVWTINEPADMRRLLGLGVDGIVTDRCDLAAGVVSEGS